MEKEIATEKKSIATENTEDTESLARPLTATKIIATKVLRHKEKGQKFKKAEKRYNALKKKEL
jgi:hypothetical protein